MTHDGLRALDVNEITENLDVGQALADLRYAARDELALRAASWTPTTIAAALAADTSPVTSVEMG